MVYGHGQPRGLFVLMVMLHATGTTHENHLINQREVQWCIVYMYMYGIV